MSTISLDEESILAILKNLNREYVIMITGQAAAGKGTLATNILEACPIEFRPKSFVSTGGLFRDQQSRCSPDMYKRIQEINDAGKLQDPSTAAALAIIEVRRIWEENSLLIMEGSPRTVKETKILYPYLINTIRKKIFLVHLTIDDDLAIERILERNEKERLAGGDVRTDTLTEESIRNKLAQHPRDVVPAVEEMARQSDVRIAPVHVVRGMTPLDAFMKVMDRAPIFQGVH